MQKSFAVYKNLEFSLKKNVINVIKVTLCFEITKISS
jgi:hypothetical protein